MKVLIVSDTHRRDMNLEKVLAAQKPIDRLIHLGDAEGTEERIQKLAGCPMDIVSGNNDYLGDLPREKDIMLGRYRVLITHGHYYYVSLDTKMLLREAHARGYDIAMFGHTHRPKLEQKNGVWLLNPGSLSYPRQEGRKPSYIIMEFEGNEEAEFTVKFLD